MNGHVNYLHEMPMIHKNVNSKNNQHVDTKSKEGRKKRASVAAQIKRV